MSILANRMKGVAPSSQVTNLLSANFNVPSRGRKTVTGNAVQLLTSSGTVEGFGFGVHSGNPLVWLRDPADSNSVVARVASDFSSLTWQRKLGTNNSSSDYTNTLGVDTSGNLLTFNVDGCVSINFSDGTNRSVKVLPSPFYSFNAIKCTTTSNEAILTGWGVSGSGTAVTQRFNTSSTSVTWGHQISSGEGPPFNQGMGIAESADGSAISYGVRVQGTTQDSWTIRRVNFSNGGQIWHYKYFETGTNSLQPTSMVESTSNLLVGTRIRSLVALNLSTGDIAWQKTYSGSGSEWHDLHWDSANGYYYGVLRGTGVLVALNTSGTTQFTREFTSSSGSFVLRGVRTDSTWMYVFGVMGSSAYVIRLPKDGTGSSSECTFANGVTISYSNITLTETTPSFTKNSTNVGVGSSTSTSSTTLTNNASTVFTLTSQGI
jgi:hypothetical protein